MQRRLKNAKHSFAIEATVMDGIPQEEQYENKRVLRTLGKIYI